MPPSTVQRLTSLDGLRGVAALSVLLQHFATETPWHPLTFAWGGIVGVQLFFVLSGFLMGRNYSTAPISREAAFDFWVKRVARVVPLFYICVTAAYAWFWITGQNVPFYGVKWPMLWQHYTFWDGQSVFWTIPREMQFYLIFPLIWLLYARLGNAANLLLIAAVAIFQTGNLGSVPALLGHLSFFLGGVVAGRIAIEPDRSYDAPFIGLLIMYVVSWPGMIDVLGLPKSLYGNISSGTLYLIYLPALVLAATASPLARRALGGGVLKRYGDMSYSLYLLHLPIYLGLRMWTPISHLPKPLWFAVNLAIVTLISYLSFRFVETPLRRWVTTFTPMRKREPEPKRLPMEAVA